MTRVGSFLPPPQLRLGALRAASPKPADPLELHRDSFDDPPSAAQSLARALSAIVASVFEDADPRPSRHPSMAPVRMSPVARAQAVLLMDPRERFGPPEPPQNAVRAALFEVSQFEPTFASQRMRQMAALLGKAA